jgi:hypothetical protein
VAILVHGTPEVVLLAAEADEHLIPSANSAAMQHRGDP